MRAKLIFIFVLFGINVGNVYSEPDISPDIIVITVCNVPSIVIFKDRKIIRTMPITVFFSLKRYEKISTKLANTPKEKINHLDAAKWTIKPTPCGVAI